MYQVNRQHGFIPSDQKKTGRRGYSGDRLLTAATIILILVWITVLAYLMWK